MFLFLACNQTRRTNVLILVDGFLQHSLYSSGLVIKVAVLQRYLLQYIVANIVEVTSAIELVALISGKHLGLAVVS